MIRQLEQDSWDELYDIEPEHFGSVESEFAIKCSKVMKDSGINKVLEIGCGYGRDSLFFATQGFKVIAVDYSTKALDILNEKLSAESAAENIEAVHCDICKGIPFGDGYFDAVYSFLLFPVGFSNSQIEFVFSEIHRVLRNNGLFLSCVRIDARSSFNENYLRLKLDGFKIDSLTTRNISVGNYQFNVVEFFLQKKEESMGASEQQVGINKSYHSMDVNEIKADIQQRLFQEEETLGIEIPYPPMEVWGDVKISSPEKIWDFTKGRYDHDKAHLYIHIPFCVSVCEYCIFVTTERKSAEEVRKYADLIKKEASLYKDVLRSRKFDSVYFGGGTPTYLRTDDLAELLKFVLDNFNFTEDVEITIECSPDTVNYEKLNSIRNLGANRLSIGVQTFDNMILKTINRRHNGERSIDAFNVARKAGFENVNMDLMYGLPNQTIDTWQKDMDTIVRLSPENITLYALTFRSHSKIHGKNYIYPSSKAKMDMYEFGRNTLLENGYFQTNRNFFTRGGFKNNNFCYQDNCLHSYPLLGLGISAFSYAPLFPYCNTPDIEAYSKAVNNGALPIARGTLISPEEEKYHYMVLGLKLAAVDKAGFKNQFGIVPEEMFGNILQALKELGLISVNDTNIRLTPEGIKFADFISRLFYSNEVQERAIKAGFSRDKKSSGGCL